MRKTDKGGKESFAVTTNVDVERVIVFTRERKFQARGISFNKRSTRCLQAKVDNCCTKCAN